MYVLYCENSPYNVLHSLQRFYLVVILIVIYTLLIVRLIKVLCISIPFGLLSQILAEWSWSTGNLSDCCTQLLPPIPLAEAG